MQQSFVVGLQGGRTSWCFAFFTSADEKQHQQKHFSKNEQKLLQSPVAQLLFHSQPAQTWAFQDFENGGDSFVAAIRNSSLKPHNDYTDYTEFRQHTMMRLGDMVNWGLEKILCERFTIFIYIYKYILFLSRRHSEEKGAAYHFWIQTIKKRVQNIKHKYSNFT